MQRQCSGNAAATDGIIKGNRVVTCMYVNPETGKHWVIDVRIGDRKVVGFPSAIMCATC